LLRERELVDLPLLEPPDLEEPLLLDPREDELFDFDPDDLEEELLLPFEELLFDAVLFEDPPRDLVPADLEDDDLDADEPFPLEPPDFEELDFDLDEELLEPDDLPEEEPPEEDLLLEELPLEELLLEEPPLEDELPLELEDEDFLGAFEPSSRASERPIAIACLRLVTFLPLRPLFSVPCLRSCIAFSTLSWDFLSYLAIAIGLLKVCNAIHFQREKV
jgi:hypothetical protein